MNTADLQALNVAISNALWDCRSAIFISLFLWQISYFYFGSQAKRFGNHWFKGLALPFITDTVQISSEPDIAVDSTFTSALTTRKGMHKCSLKLLFECVYPRFWLSGRKLLWKRPPVCHVTLLGILLSLEALPLSMPNFVHTPWMSNHNLQPWSSYRFFPRITQIGTQYL